MKKILTCIVAVFMAGASFAQIQKGKVFLNGQLGFSAQRYQNNKDRKDNTFFLTPSMGFFVSDKVAVGLGIGIQTSKSEGYRGYQYNSNSRAFSIASFSRIYFGTSADKFKFFLQPKIALGFVKNKYSNNWISYPDPILEPQEVELKNTELDFSLSPGFSYTPSSHWAFEFLIKGFYVYTNNPEGDDNRYTSTGFGIASTIQPTLVVSPAANGSFAYTQENRLVNSFNPTIGLSYFF